MKRWEQLIALELLRTTPQLSQSIPGDRNEGLLIQSAIVTCGDAGA